ncbi:MAG: hypothetical protein NT154_39535 [Verrucomicrobia bacterium]|nr:hypothetical protein [Verrucomicrobiota bacterium]
MNERMRRRWAAAEALTIGWGGMKLVIQATGMSRKTVSAALKELRLSPEQRRAEAQRVRRPGGGRRPLISRQAIVELIASTTTRAGLTVRAELDTNN